MARPGRKPARPKMEEVLEKVDPAVLVRPSGPLYEDEERYQLVQRMLDLLLRQAVERLEKGEEMSAADRGEMVKLLSTFERHYGSDVKSAIAQKKMQQSMMGDLPTFEGDDDDPLLDKEAYQAPFEGKKDSEDEDAT